MEYTLVGTPTGRILALSGAPMRWKSDAGKNDVYVPGVRVVGTEGAVRAWLSEHGKDVSLLEGAFRAGDQTTQRYKDAVRAVRPPPVPRAPKEPKSVAAAVGHLRSPLRMVRQFNARIALDQPIKLRNQRNEEKTSPCKSVLLRKVRAGDEDTTEDTVLGAPLTPHKHIVALQKRMASLPPQKVLDITTYDPTTGKGARTLPKPSVRDLTRRGVPDVPLVSRTGAPLRTLLELLGMPERVAEVTW